MTRDEAVAAVLAVFPDAQLVGERPIEPIPWCDAFTRELEEARKEGEKALFYAELLWVAYAMGRKLGWAAFFFKDVHGVWPPWDWKEQLRPMQPRESTWKQVRRRDRLAREAWKEMKRKEREDRGDTSTEAEDREEAEIDADLDAGEDGGMEGEFGASFGDGDDPDGERLT